MNKSQIEFMKNFIRVLEKATFNVSGIELIQIAQQVQMYSKIIIEIENSLKEEEKK